MEERGTKEGIQIYYPSRILCTDNAAMIGSAAYYNYRKGLISELSLNAEPNLGLN
jgi:N6-L-threonylcarbamoyladenine synthase